MAHVTYLALAGFLGGPSGRWSGLAGASHHPVLVLFLDVPIHSAVSASLLGGGGYLDHRLHHLSAPGAVQPPPCRDHRDRAHTGCADGGIVGAMLDKQALSAIFGV